ncbi:nucleotidyl transferase AbiEii/AbiGii toxin family protein [Cryobacterium melibiosiphilum]|uniref:Nucleotidyl transferase AbiEii/AbiGii toxin family protein n=1 Tax=Cryobacterium melibiosiphilum TaxID=995039 RepID=A0A3A5MYH9_9MICO|nr:nucleotidyl transferase AbiEii/AbiGii toxin family protein [Cryobacterium melibiosiphilum]RJT92288.1 nucleotidyl transferase AbiEii/AbiGii toxin family protein [Cryobacterium melibiosiphilum]
MSHASQLYAALHRHARASGRAVSETVILYAMEAFLSRLSQTIYKDDFVLKGGVLLAAYRLRRPTSDIDMEAVNFHVDAAHLLAVVEVVAAVSVDDALAIDPARTDIRLIREGDDYSGLRVKIFAHVYTSALSFHLDISTGDPIWPDPRSVTVPRILGGEFEMLGYPLVMVVAEKAVTMLTRGTTSTRWRDIVDLRNFSLSHDFSASEVRGAAQRVADFRQVPLTSVAVATAGWPAIAQPKWAAWRRKLALTEICLESFDDQLADVIEFVDPVFTGAVRADEVWDSSTQRWRKP